MPVNNIPAVYNKKIQFYNRIYRFTLLILVVVITGAILIGVRQIFMVGHKVDSNVQNTQSIIKANQQSTLDARKQNSQRQQDLANYVKCLSLARFDHPELLLPTVTRQQVSNALDECAKTQ